MDPTLSQPFDPDFRKEFYRLLQARRSIRKFKTDPLPRELVEKVLAAGFQAPSGKNRQNWRFYVLTGEKRDQYLKLSQKSWLGINAYWKNA
jgi:nitroreductase